MDRVSIKKIKFKLMGESKIEKGLKLEFKGIDQEGKEVDIAKIKGKKVISVFPKLNTSTCDMQTARISELAKEKKDIEFISITNDTVDTIKKWCGDHSINNISILSDAKYGEFAALTNLLIKKMKLLARGLIVLDENNVVTDFNFKEAIEELPDFEIIK